MLNVVVLSVVAPLQMLVLNFFVGRQRSGKLLFEMNFVIIKWPLSSVETGAYFIKHHHGNFNLSRVKITREIATVLGTALKYRRNLPPLHGSYQGKIVI